MVTRLVSYSFNKNFKPLIHHVMVFLQKFRTARYKSHLCKFGRVHSKSDSNLQYVNLPTWDQSSDFRKMKTSWCMFKWCYTLAESETVGGCVRCVVESVQTGFPNLCWVCLFVSECQNTFGPGRQSSKQCRYTLYMSPTVR